jgi:hypothetical protein
VSRFVRPHSRCDSLRAKPGQSLLFADPPKSSAEWTVQSGDRPDNETVKLGLCSHSRSFKFLGHECPLSRKSNARCRCVCDDRAVGKVSRARAPASRSEHSWLALFLVPLRRKTPNAPDEWPVIGGTRRASAANIRVFRSIRPSARSRANSA